MGSIILLDLMGGVALLLWGLHMVRSGIMRAFGSELRRILSIALRNRFLALLAGFGVTALLQAAPRRACYRPAGDRSQRDGLAECRPLCSLNTGFAGAFLRHFLGPVCDRRHLADRRCFERIRQ